MNLLLRMKLFKEWQTRGYGNREDLWGAGLSLCNRMDNILKEAWLKDREAE